MIRSCESLIVIVAAMNWSTLISVTSLRAQRRKLRLPARTSTEKVGRGNYRIFNGSGDVS